MKKIMLMGARRFIDMPTGTLYISLWKNSTSDCIDLIEEFMKDPKEFLDYSDMEVYGDNGGSMGFSQDDEDHIFYYDANVVGDASPTHTLYVVLDANVIPDSIEFPNLENMDEHFTLTREEILEIRNKFMGFFDSLDNINNHQNDWARQELDKYAAESKLNEMILNLFMECILEE